jgi:hypothetical protein
MVLDEELRHVLDVVDAAAQLALLADVVDADQQGATPAGTVGVLEGVALGSAVAKLLGALRRGRGGTRVLARSAVCRPVGDRVAVGIVALRRRPLRRPVLLLLLVVLLVMLRLAVALVLLRGVLLLLRVLLLLLGLILLLLKLAVAVLLLRRRLPVAAVLRGRGTATRGGPVALPGGSVRHCD